MTFDEYGHFGEAVNNYEDGIESARSWKLRDKIHRKRVPRLRWNGKWLEFVVLRMVWPKWALLDVVIHYCAICHDPLGSARRT